MNLNLIKGQKIDLTKNTENLNFLHIGLDWKTSKIFDIDASAFLIGEDGKIVREEDFVFYGQPHSSNGSVRIEDSMSTIEKQRFIINLQKIPDEVHKISFTLTIYESDINKLTFADVNELKLRIIDSSIQEEIAAFPIDYAFTQESAIVLGTLYRYSGEWKFHAVGAGFYGGLADLCKEYGVDVIERADEDSSQAMPSISPNNRFEVVQEREATGKGEVIPKQQTELVQLKRSEVVQFDQDRINELSVQSTKLVNIFEEQVERTNFPISSETMLPPSLDLFDDTEEDQEGFIQSLTESESAFLRLMINGSVSLPTANQFIRAQATMPALFLNAINEKASEYLGENLLQEGKEEIIIDEEFQSIIQKIKERVGNEY